MDGGPFAFTLRVARLNPELLELYEATPRGLLDVDVWLGPAADEREPEYVPEDLRPAGGG